MKVLTVKSAQSLDQSTQLDVHYTFGMEKHTDYVLKDKGERSYSSTIVLEETVSVIEHIVKASTSFPGMEFIIDDLDMEKNSIERYRVREGEIIDKLQSGWDWESGH